MSNLESRPLSLRSEHDSLRCNKHLLMLLLLLPLLLLLLLLLAEKSVSVIKFYHAILITIQK